MGTRSPLPKQAIREEGDLPVSVRDIGWLGLLPSWSRGGRLTMNHKITAPIPEGITQLQHQLEQFRSTQPGRTKLPEGLWQAAVELARQHGIYAVAHPLRLDYTRLKERLNGIPSRSREPKPAKPTFVELIGSSAATLPECVIEFESVRGGKMRIQWKAAAPPDWGSLLRAWRETQV
jgi:hypothetical protein